MSMHEPISFWRELRSRHVVRAAVAHLVFFWLLAQIAETVLPYIGVVDEPVRWAVVAGAALFPVTLVVAWLFEHPWHKFTSGRLATDVVIILVIAVSTGIWAVKNMPQVVHTRTSIVVLPFTHTNSNSNDKGLSRALAYEINSLLMKSKSIDVVGYESASSSVLAGLDALAAAKRLGVKHVLSGVIHSVDESLNISTSLLNQTGQVVWTAQIEDQLDNLYSVQARIASEVQAHLGYGDEVIPIADLAALRCDMPGDQDALQRYYTARHFMEKRTDNEQSAAELNQAATLFEGLIEDYPDFAEARSGLAWTLMYLLSYDLENQDREVNKQRSDGLAQEALDLCETLGEALVILPNEADDKSNNWISWEQNLQLWMKLQPEATENYQKYIRHLREVGRVGEATRVAEKNYALNPLSVRSIKNLSYVYQYEERFTEAIALVDEARVLGSAAPNFAQQGQNFYNCDFDPDCVLEEIPPHFQPFKIQLRQIISAPATPSELEASLQLAEDLLRESPWMVNLFNGMSCWYDHMTPLFFKTWEINEETGDYWYWPNLWLKSCANVWESEAFPAFAEQVGLVAYWRAKGWPDACRPEGESFMCGQAIYQENMQGSDK
jgi:TolB-like protein